MEMDEKYDGHTVFIKCSKFLSDIQIINAFKLFLNNYIDKTGDNIECEYYVNIITNKDDISYGLAFVYISNTEVYYMLFGRNKDGSERCEYIDDPKWIEPPRIRSSSNSRDLKLLEEKKNSLNKSNSLLEVDWGVIMEADEEYERKENEVKNRHVCPKIKVTLEPLMVPIINDKNITNEEFYIEPALPSEVQNNSHNHIIKCTNLPENINVDDLNVKFRPFVSDATSTYKRKHKGKITEHEYPYITITNDRTAFVIFDENTNDARFAIHMSKKTIINNNKLWFSFSSKKDQIEENEQNSYGNKKPYNNSPNNRSPYSNGSPNNRSPYNNRSPNNKNYNNRSPNKVSNNINKDQNDNIADTDGFRYVKYNRK